MLYRHGFQTSSDNVDLQPTRHCTNMQSWILLTCCNKHKSRLLDSSGYVSCGSTLSLGTPHDLDYKCSVLVRFLI